MLYPPSHGRDPLRRRRGHIAQPHVTSGRDPSFGALVAMGRDPALALILCRVDVGEYTWSDRRNLGSLAGLPSLLIYTGGRMSSNQS